MSLALVNRDRFTSAVQASNRQQQWQQPDAAREPQEFLEFVNESGWGIDTKLWAHCTVQWFRSNKKHSHSFHFRSKLTDYLPAWVCKSSWSFRGRSPRSSLEHKLLRHFQDVSQKVTDVKACHKMFLEFCWNFSFYG